MGIERSPDETTGLVGDSKLKTGVYAVLAQLAIYGIPLIVTPRVISTVGIAHFGAFGFMQVTVGVIAVLVQYGFVQSGVRDIAAAACHGRDEVSREYSVIFFSKALMTVLAIAVGAILLLIPRFQLDGSLYLYSITGLAIFWLDTGFVFQGIEKMRIFMFLNLLGGVLSMAAVFAFLRVPEDYVILPLLFNIPRIAAYGAGIWILGRTLSIHLRVPRIEEVLSRLADGFHFFVTNVLVVGYTRIHMLILGLQASNSAVGYYTVADQIIGAYMSLQGMATSGFHAQIVRDLKKSAFHETAQSKISFVVISILAFFGILYVYFFGENLLAIFLKGGESGPAVFSLRILSLNFLTIGLGSMIVIQVLLTIRQERYLFYFSFLAALLSTPFCWWIVPRLHQDGAAITVFLVNFAGLPWVWIAARRHGFRFVNGAEVVRLALLFLIAAAVFKGARYLSDLANFRAGWRTFAITGTFCVFSYPLILWALGFVEKGREGWGIRLLPKIGQKKFFDL